MQFFTTAFAAAALFVAAVAAVNVENPFILPAANDVLKAGTSYKVEWKVTKGQTVELILRKGLSTSLDTVGVLETSLTNTGSYVWKIDSKLPAGNDYALEIRYGDEVEETNYTGQFSIDSEVKRVASTNTGANVSTGKTDNSTSSGMVTSTVATNGTGSTSLPTESQSDSTATASPTGESAAGRAVAVSIGAVAVAVLAAGAFLG